MGKYCITSRPMASNRTHRRLNRHVHERFLRKLLCKRWMTERRPKQSYKNNQLLMLFHDTGLKTVAGTAKYGLKTVAGTAKDTPVKPVKLTRNSDSSATYPADRPPITRSANPILRYSPFRSLDFRPCPFRLSEPPSTSAPCVLNVHNKPANQAINPPSCSSNSQEHAEKSANIPRIPGTLITDPATIQSSKNHLDESNTSSEDPDAEKSGDNDDPSQTVRLNARKTAAVATNPPAKYSSVIKYHTDQGFRPLLCAFRNLQWRDFANRGRWHMFWANVQNARNLFQPGQRYYFNDDQLVNHYQSCYHLSRKDNMTKNIKKFRNEMAHLKEPIGRKDRHGNFVYLDLIAPTYLLPFDFNTFVTDFKRNGGLYIVKPCSGSQGQGMARKFYLGYEKRHWIGSD